MSYRYVFPSAARGECIPAIIDRILDDCRIGKVDGDDRAVDGTFRERELVGE